MKTKTVDKAFCLKCNDKTPYNLRERYVEVSIKGLTFIYPEQYACCSRCSKELYVPAVNDENCERIKHYYITCKNEGD